MKEFSGFPNGKLEYTRIPFQFFSQILPDIRDIGELKVTLYSFWFIGQQEDAIRYITRSDFEEDEVFMQGLGKDRAEQEKVLTNAIHLTVERGTLISVDHPDGKDENIYFLNSQRGRNAVRLINLGTWRPGQNSTVLASLDHQVINIYRLYEQNIGTLTPMIAEELEEAEKSYSSEWIEEAIQIAVQNNVRKWNYVEAILRSWQEKGRDGSDRGNSTRNRRSYIEGELSDFINH